MQKILPFIVLFTMTFMVIGCNPPVTPIQPAVPTQPSIPTQPAAPTQAAVPTQPAAPTQPAVPTSPLPNVTCNELSFYLDPALGDGFECVSVPENSSSDIPAYYVFIYPAHTELTIQNYPLPQTQFPPQLWVYPVSRFNELLPDILPSRLSDLEHIISNGIRSNGELPFLPVIPQKQGFYVHAASISFDGGTGVRFITEYSDAPTPITNSNIFYTFQGLTDDGQYWVAVTLPISSPILPDDYDSMPEGYTRESLILSYQSYVREVKEALEAQAPSSFSPSIDSLDSLVKSILIRQ